MSPLSCRSLKTSRSDSILEWDKIVLDISPTATALHTNLPKRNIADLTLLCPVRIRGQYRTEPAMRYCKKTRACIGKNIMVCKSGLCSAYALRGQTLQSTYLGASGIEFDVWCFDTGNFVREVASMLTFPSAQAPLLLNKWFAVTIS